MASLAIACRRRTPPARLGRRRITTRKSRYDLGKSFFTNITPGYQLYPTVMLLPWTDPSAPSEQDKAFNTIGWGGIGCERIGMQQGVGLDAQGRGRGQAGRSARCLSASPRSTSLRNLPMQSCQSNPTSRPKPLSPRHAPTPLLHTTPDDHFLLFYTCRTGQVVRLTSDNQFLPMWNLPGLEPQVCGPWL